ncbi:MAG TPA: site-specific DNA-methyltransferase [Anaerolineae bacterium]|nr:site-specific DNA-methyltransferase [Anaerolineae bacterium]HID85631.1 site-specific DNA-methyltransferase [Anaerolineales bacterium]HIQ08140.1 site-specific DNA-methyltransferase [Anaerolineaceae bacterium]
MPVLQFREKETLPEASPAPLVLDRIVHPQQQAGEPRGWLIQGDNLAVMRALAERFPQGVPLIYTDPPFFTNKRYAVRVGRGEDSRRPETWQLAEGYADRWPDLDAYLAFLWPRLQAMYRLLAPNGTLYVHLDWHAAPYVRVLLDELFGPRRLLNEIVWVYHGPSPIRRAFNRKHDTILAYTKGDDYFFNADAVRVPYHPNTVETFKASSKAGFGKVPDLKRGKVPEDWWYFPVVARLHKERTGYPTQKPEALVERVLRASSHEGDWIGDVFLGSGTTAVVAARLGRRFVGVDASWRAIHIAAQRLVLAGAPPFVVWRVGQVPVPTPEPPQGWGVQRTAQGLALRSPNWAAVETWEVDPDYDGQVFRSQIQGVRPFRGVEPLPRILPFPEGETKTRTVAVRVVLRDGQELRWLQSMSN